MSGQLHVPAACTSPWRKPFPLSGGAGWVPELVDQDVLGKRPVFRSCRNSKPVSSGLQLKVIRWDDMEWTDVAQHWDKWEAVVNTVMNRWASWNAGNLMTSLGNAGRTQLLGVTIKYSLYYFADKNSVVLSLWWSRLCEIGYLLWALPCFVRLLYTAVRTIQIYPFLSELFLSQPVRYKSHS